MSQTLANVVFAAGIIGLFLLERGSRSKVSLALWIPVMWVSIGASR